MAVSSASTFSGSFCLVSMSSRLMRPTWVSTGSPGKPKATLRTTLPVLRPTPGSVTRSSRAVGTSHANRSHTATARATTVLDLTLKKPVGRIIASTSSGIGAGQVGRVGVHGEQGRSDRVDTFVCRLGAEHCGHQQLPRGREIKLAELFRRPRVLAGQAGSRQLGPARRCPGPANGRRPYRHLDRHLVLALAALAGSTGSATGASVGEEADGASSRVPLRRVGTVSSLFVPEASFSRRHRG